MSTEIPIKRCNSSRMNQQIPITADLETLMNIPPESLTEAQIHHLHSIQIRQELYLEISEREDDIYPRETAGQTEKRERLRALLRRVPGYFLPNRRRDAWVWMNPLRELMGVLRDGQRRYPERSSIGRSIRYVEGLLEEMEWILDGGESRGEAEAVGEEVHWEPEERNDSLNRERRELMRTLRSRNIPNILTAIDSSTLQDEDRECSICQNTLGMDAHGTSHEASRLPCGHYFGIECITRWLQTSSTCPICRHDYKKQLDNLEVLSIAELTRLGEILRSLWILIT